MSRYFVLPEEGKPGGDIVFRPLSVGYALWVGDDLLGQVSNLGARRMARWTGVSFAQDSEHFKVRMMAGFATRLDAAGFVIRHHGYWVEREAPDVLT